MTLAADLKTLYHLTLAPIRGQTHADRLESFYGRQAEGYDEFRNHLLPGRAELWQSLDVPDAGVWVDMGGGTGSNLEYLGDRLCRLSQAYVVDLSPSLLQMARRRIEQHGWNNVTAVEADATRFELPAGQADVVTFSYSLTMIPNWFEAIDRAYQLLRPGGTLAAVDFYVARKYPAAGQTRHGWLTRSFWPAWFSCDNVYPCADHLPYLQARFGCQRIEEGRARMRYFPVARVPYYQFVGVKPLD